MKIEGCTALVTGGAVRIGRAICIELAAHGCHVVVHYRNSAGPADTLIDELKSCGVQASAVCGDLETEASCEGVFATAKDQAGRLDILVNNASIFERHAFLDAAASDYERHWRINCLSAVVLTRAFARYRQALTTSREGVVINLLDRRVAEAPADCMPYLLSKKALAAFTKSAARALRPAIRVNGVAPGGVLPAIQVGESEPSDAAFEPRASAPDVARAVLALVESDGVTGRTIYVGGSPESRVP